MRMEALIKKKTNTKANHVSGLKENNDILH